MFATLNRLSTPMIGLLLPLLVGCGEEELPGNLFEMRLSGKENLCTDEGEDYEEVLTYRLVIEGRRIRLAVGEDEWAEGSIDGCRIQYQSIVWGSLHDGFEVRWRINGEAEIDQTGGASCIDDDSLDWVGTETFTVVTSADESVDPGCTYSLRTQGRFSGFASEPEDDEPTAGGIPL